MTLRRAGLSWRLLKRLCHPQTLVGELSLSFAATGPLSALPELSGRGFRSKPDLPPGCAGCVFVNDTSPAAPCSRPLQSPTRGPELAPARRGRREVPSVAHGPEDPRLFLMDDNEVGMVRAPLRR